MSKNVIRDGQPRYAIKQLRTDLEENEHFMGIMDLALEAKFLAVLDHPHILKLRGVGLAGYLHPEFFLVLDRLYNTLDDQCLKWGVKLRSTSIKKILDIKGKHKKEFLCERIAVAYDIAAAVHHMHENKVLYRDLSPDNIGFDVRGEVKIFDFGLAKELLPSLRLDDGAYELTGYTGSLRYMAPEVVLCKPYNETADVFSFGVLLWHITSCIMPYQNYTIKMYERNVVKLGHRPPQQKKWPNELNVLMKACWADKVSDRPRLDSVKDRLKYFILGESADKDIEFDVDMSMKSFYGSKNRRKSTTDAKTKELLRASTPEVNPDDFDTKAPTKKLSRTPVQSQ